MIRFPKRVVVVSPNSTLGSAFLRALGEFDSKVVGIGRRKPDTNDTFIHLEDFSATTLRDAANTAAEVMGGVDLVVSFIGMHHENQSLLESDLSSVEETFEEVERINATIPFLLNAVFSRIMMGAGGGHILHLASNASTHALYQSHAYTSSKHALLGVVRSAATELAPYGIRVNCVAPGTVATKLNEKKLYSSGSLTPRGRSILAHTPTKEFASSDGVISTILSMCMEQPHLTGNIVFCDDGYSVEGHSWPEGNDSVYGIADDRI